MTDPGWDIPGVPRDTPSDAATPLGASHVTVPAGDAVPSAAQAHRSKPAHPYPAGSASASAGLSAGAFTSSGDGAAGRTTTDSSGPDHAGCDRTSSADMPAGAASGLRPDGPAQALEFLSAALDYLAHTDAAGWSAGMQADCLRALAVAESRHLAAHAKALAAFSVPGGGLAGDGHGSPRMWLSWQTQATRRAAANQVGWMKRLQAHQRVASALADGELSPSWARQICDWSEQLPPDRRDDADRTLLAAANSGADMSALSGLAEELLRRHAPADSGDDGFEDRRLYLAPTFGGTARLEGDLTARCAAAVDGVLGSLSARRGPEDTRSLGQRQHDALEEACLRLLASGCLPQRAGQPVRLELSITLEQLAAGGDGSLAGPGAACDADIQPVVTGNVDPALLQRLADTADADEPAAANAPKGQPGLTLERGDRAAVRTGRVRRSAAAAADRYRGRLDQPAAGHRRHRGHDPGAPAPGRQAQGRALSVPRLRPAARRLRRPPHHLPQRRWPACPNQYDLVVSFPSSCRDPPVVLAVHPLPRRHYHRHQPRRHQNPAQPRPASPRRVTRME